MGQESSLSVSKVSQSGSYVSSMPSKTNHDQVPAYIQERQIVPKESEEAVDKSVKPFPSAEESIEHKQVRKTPRCTNSSIFYKERQCLDKLHVIP